MLDSDDSLTDVVSRPYPGDVITIQSSSSDNSDVEILSPPFRPLEVSNSSRDQPSTSTGIRDSVDRPNNRLENFYFKLLIKNDLLFFIE